MNGWTFTWQGGRQLAGMSNGTTTLSFAYNDSGLRTSKTVGNTTHTYTYQGSTLVADKTATDAMYFHYDQNGSVIGFTYDDGTTSAEYYYVKNLQGDILGILDASGALVASYTYDAWGNILTATDTALANRNPIRYRGYYYDTETELYYLQTRYYDAAVGRFINADGYVQTDWTGVEANVFSYCMNEPVYNMDSAGTDTFSIGVTANANCFLGVSFSLSLAFDDSGGFDVQYSYAIPFVDGTVSAGVMDVGAGVFAQYTNADTVSDLYGISSSIGASGGAGVSVGGDVIYLGSAVEPFNQEDDAIDGGQISIGYGAGLDAHIIQSQTGSVIEKFTEWNSGLNSLFLN